MATKQTEELGLYCGSLEYLEDDSFLSYADILAWSEWEVKRISMPKFVEYIKSNSTPSIGEDYNDWAGFVGKSITIDKIKSSGHTTRGICFPDGISLCEKDVMDSWIGYWQVNPNSYGFQDNTNIPANVCYGTFGMNTVYIQDLYVKNLHTADSSSSGDSSSEMETATITNLTIDTLIPNNDTIHICGHLDMGGGFEIKYIGGIEFTTTGAPNQRYLVANNQKDYEVFNSNGGFVNVYSQTEIDNKIKALEARIAALESK